MPVKSFLNLASTVPEKNFQTAIRNFSYSQARIYINSCKLFVKRSFINCSYNKIVINFSYKQKESCMQCIDKTKIR